MHKVLALSPETALNGLVVVALDRSDVAHPTQSIQGTTEVDQNLMMHLLLLSLRGVVQLGTAPVQAAQTSADSPQASASIRASTRIIYLHGV